MAGVLAGLIGSLKGIVQKVLTSFTSYTAPTSLYYSAATYFPANNTFYATGATTSTSSPTSSYIYSSNGTSFTSGTLPTSDFFRSAAASASRIIICGTGTGAASVTSTNGTSWSTLDIGIAGASAVPVAAVYDGSRFVVVDTNSTSNIHVSTDGVSWTTVTGTGVGASHMAYNGVASGVYLATGTGTSTNAKVCVGSPAVSGNWATRTLPASLVWTWVGYAPASNLWLATAAGSTTAAISSNDGTSWTTVTLPATTSASATGFRPQLFTFDSTFYYYAPTKVMYKSTDGVTWTNLGTITSNLVTVLSSTNNGTISLIFGTATGTSSTTAYILGAQ